MHPPDYLYSQSTGRFYHNLLGVAQGYSGSGAYKNDPSFEHLPNLGPIPRGLWLILPAYHHPRLGPISIPLEPVNHDAHSRFAFFIHGDSIKAPGSASSGCIILPRIARAGIAAATNAQRPPYLLVLE